MTFQGHILTRNAHLLEMFPSGAVSLPVLATVPRWLGPSLFAVITFILLRNIKGKSY
jgi:hypothetical protein